MKEQTTTMKINEAALDKKIGLMVVKKILREFATSGTIPGVEKADGQSPHLDPQSTDGMKNLSATRRLKIRAAEASLDFESIMQKELDLIHQDKMDGLSQKAYIQAMERMKDMILNAVLEAVQAVAHLPKESDQQEAGQATTASKPKVNLNMK